MKSVIQCTMNGLNGIEWSPFVDGFDCYTIHSQLYQNGDNKPPITQISKSEASWNLGE